MGCDTWTCVITLCDGIIPQRVNVKYDYLATKAECGQKSLPNLSSVNCEQEQEWAQDTTNTRTVSQKACP